MRASFPGSIGAAFIRGYLRVFGRTVRKADVPWLLGPIGPEGEIGDRPYHMVAESEGLTIDHTAPDAGLLPDFDVLSGGPFRSADTHPAVRHFYEHTSHYDLDVWSETRFPGRLFLWLLVSTVSRYMNQLNFPVFGLETSRGMTSEVLPLRDAHGRAVHTGWQRRLLGTGRIIYTGFYTTVQPPNCASPQSALSAHPARTVQGLCGRTRRFTLRPRSPLPRNDDAAPALPHPSQDRQFLTTVGFRIPVSNCARLRAGTLPASEASRTGAR